MGSAEDSKKFRPKLYTVQYTQGRQGAMLIHKWTSGVAPFCGRLQVTTLFFVETPLPTQNPARHIQKIWEEGETP